MNGSHRSNNGHTNSPRKKRASSSKQQRPQVKVFLSRPSYTVGSTVVGSVVIQPPPTTSDDRTAESLRSMLSSVTVYVAGYCRIDPRWHNVSDYIKLYGSVHPMLQLLESSGGWDRSCLVPSSSTSSDDPSNNTVCVWATNGLELLDLSERSYGPWPPPEVDIIDDNDMNDEENEAYHQQQQKQQAEAEENGHEQTPPSLTSNGSGGDHKTTASTSHPDRLHFTFRADLPMDLPHSSHTTTCRYFYTAVVLIHTKQHQPSNRMMFRIPFLVTTHPSQPLPPSQRQLQQQNDKPTVISSRVKFGTVDAIAHSIGLPVHISATDMSRPKGQMSVKRPGGGPQQQSTTGGANTIQTLRVANAMGQPVCVLTVVGAAQLTPGSNIQIQWDFPEVISSSKNWIPCHQVGACLMGDEYAMYEDSSMMMTNNNSGNNTPKFLRRKRAAAATPTASSSSTTPSSTKSHGYIFDTCHEWVDPGITHRVSKTLWLPMDAPCCLITDVMELTIQLQVDITIREKGDYNNLRLAFPCQVLHALDRRLEEEDEEHRALSLAELLGEDEQKGTPSKPAKKDEFSTEDIRSDLKQLALKIEELL